jgi:pimeloyl-ACP methyl ester carboxylesterase
MSRLIRIAHWSAEASTSVIFVHGLGGHHYGTWGDVNGGFFWPRFLAAETPGGRVYTVSYAAAATNWIGTAMPIQDRATNVLELLLTEREVREAPVVFVCHSLGGLIVKQILLSLHEQARTRTDAEQLLQMVHGVVFIATPHSGSRKATLLERLRLVVWPTAATIALAANTPELRRLNTSYRRFAEERRDSLHHLIFYEMQPTKAGSIVDEISSDPGLSTGDAIAVDADHVSICKGRQSDDLVVKLVQQFVRARARVVERPGDIVRDDVADNPGSFSLAGVLPKLVRLTLLAVLFGLILVTFGC